MLPKAAARVQPRGFAFQVLNPQNCFQEEQMRARAHQGCRPIRFIWSHCFANDSTLVMTAPYLEPATRLCCCRATGDGRSHCTDTFPPCSGAPGRTLTLPTAPAHPLRPSQGPSHGKRFTALYLTTSPLFCSLNHLYFGFLIYQECDI